MQAGERWYTQLKIQDGEIARIGDHAFAQNPTPIQSGHGRRCVYTPWRTHTCIVSLSFSLFGSCCIRTGVVFLVGPLVYSASWEGIIKKKNEYRGKSNMNPPRL